MSELGKYFKSETVEILRSEITPAPYNPRTITDAARQSLKKSLKQYGVIGGLVWNRTTSNLVSGHQKLSILDELNKYNPQTRENDYMVKVEAIAVDEKTERELNIFFNNPSTQGQWDYDLLREMIPDIDYRAAGLTDEDLSIIGVDFMLQTPEESDIADSLDEMMAPVRAEKALAREERKADIVAKKQRAAQEAEQKARDMEAYVMLSFDSFKAKAAFMARFGFEVGEKFVKGEVFSDMVERIE
jgi:hypothetical protein